MKYLIRTIVLAIISIIIFVLSSLISLGHCRNEIRGETKGGETKEESREKDPLFELQCRISNPLFININSLLKNDYYVFATDDNRIINDPHIRTFYWRTKNGMNCLEVIQPEVDTNIKSGERKKSFLEKSLTQKERGDKEGKVPPNWAIPIILDIIKYKDIDVRNLDFNKRIKILKDFCHEVKLEPPKYTLFDHTKNLGEQFSKILKEGKKETKVMIFKNSEKKYFHPKSSFKWINKNLLKMTGIVSGTQIEFIRSKEREEKRGEGEKMAPLINNEFPIKNLVELHKEGDEDVTVYIKDNIPKIRAASRYEIDNGLTSFHDAKDIWIQMNKGLTIDGFLGDTLDIMKKLQRNAVDYKLFRYIDDRSSLLDIGAGRGANIFMWKRKKLDVYAVEPDEKNYDGLVNKKNIYNIHTLKAGGEDISKIMNFIPDDGVDYISMIYSLTFFFKDEKTLNNLVKLVDDALKPGGYYIGTVMDGHKLLRWASDNGKKNIKKVLCPPFTIKIENDHKVFINIDDPVTLVKNQKEYIVDFELLKKKLSIVGIKLNDTGFLKKEARLLNKCPRKFTELSRWFIFEKK